MPQYVDALLYPMDEPVSVMNDSASSPLNYTYRFDSTMPAGWSTYSGFVAMNDTQQQIFKNILVDFESVINVKFTETSSESPTIHAGLASLPSGMSGYGGFRYSYKADSSGEVTSSTYEGITLFKSSSTFLESNDRYTIIHEIGHALGLKHPGNYDAGDSTAIGPFISGAEDNNKYTVMSYNKNPDTKEYADSLMPYDIAALQARWGANNNTATGNDVYGKTAYKVKCIWDADGTDTMDGSAETNAVSIDLRQGAYSSIGGTNNVCIAYNTFIENADGGSANDTIIGNMKANIIRGDYGDDFLNGKLGPDTLYGGMGNDTIRGGQGVDTLHGDEGNDTLVGGIGADTLYGDGGADYFEYEGDYQSYPEKCDTIADFSRKEGDKIVLDVKAFVSAGQATLESALDTASPSSLTAALDAAAKNNKTNNGVSIFTFSGDTYVFLEIDGAAKKYNGTDLVFMLSGSVDLTFAKDFVVKS